jgi:hypothetical protein
MIMHTPGPWTLNKAHHTDAEPDEYAIIATIDRETCRIADVYSHADARLITQAPAMLELLKCYIGAHKSMTPTTLARYDSEARAILRAVED